MGLCEFAKDGRRFRGAWEHDLWVQSSADPMYSKLRGPGLARAIAGVPAKASLKAFDEDRNQRLCGGDTFRAWLQKPPKAAQADADAAAAAATHEQERMYGVVTDNGDGTYEVSYSATKAGMYELHVTTADGEHVSDSPYPVRVRVHASDACIAHQCADACTCASARRGVTGAGRRVRAARGCD
jgi:hypothetical protein